MATKKEIKEHLRIALKEIGEIKPWFDKDFKNWIFSHPNYPVEYAGDSEEEAIKNYPLYLQDFIEERLNDNLSSFTEKETIGRGGKREGSGRPKGTIKEPTKRVTLPLDIAEWISKPDTIEHLRGLGLGPHDQRWIAGNR
jgi:hypothetical protein